MRNRHGRSPGPATRRGGLVISRNDGQDTIIDLPDGGQIVISAFDCSHGRTKLQIAAPANYNIRRAELPAQESLAAAKLADGNPLGDALAKPRPHEAAAAQPAA